MRHPSLTETELSALEGIVVHADGVTVAELQGSTLLLRAIGEGAADFEHVDVAELDLPDSRVINLRHLVKWALANGY